MRNTALAMISMVLASLPMGVSADEFHVAMTGDDTHAGDAAHPFRTIDHAAQLARPGDIVIVHAGTYRERVTPVWGGSAEQPIVYRAATGEAVAIKGSERVTSWAVDSGTVWSVTLPSAYFGAFNPYTATLSGSYLVSGQWHHLGQVYLDEDAYREMRSLTEVQAMAGTWYTTRSGDQTVIYANFGGADPNASLAEINVRPTIFFPSTPGNVDHITVEGFTISQAATDWAPPNADVQEGAIGSLGGAYWTIRNCTIRDSRNVAISFGNYGGFDTNVANIGHHLVQNNVIQRCGEAGIAGSRFVSSSRIVGNLIEDISHLDEFFGYEQANIKFHNSCDVVIEGNLIRQRTGHSLFGVWMDWANINTRMSRNIIEGFDGIYQLEEDHGPMLFDNNIFIGGKTIEFSARGTVGAHNLYVRVSDPFGGADASRSPSIFRPHSIDSSGSAVVEQNHDDKRFNNVYVGFGLQAPNAPGAMDDHNLYLAGASRSFYSHDTHGMTSAVDPGFAYASDERGFRMSWDPGVTLDAFTVPLLTSDTFGVFSPVGMRVENPDGSTITLDHDFFGMPRSGTNPRVGPFATDTAMMDRVLFDISAVGAGTPSIVEPHPDAGVAPGRDGGTVLPGQDGGVAPQLDGGVVPEVDGGGAPLVFDGGVAPQLDGGTTMGRLRGHVCSVSAGRSMPSASLVLVALLFGLKLRRTRLLRARF